MAASALCTRVSGTDNPTTSIPATKAMVLGSIIPRNRSSSPAADVLLAGPRTACCAGRTWVRERC